MNTIYPFLGLPKWNFSNKSNRTVRATKTSLNPLGPTKSRSLHDFRSIQVRLLDTVLAPCVPGVRRRTWSTWYKGALRHYLPRCSASRRHRTPFNGCWVRVVSYLRKRRFLWLEPRCNTTTNRIRQITYLKMEWWIGMTLCQGFHIYRSYWHIICDDHSYMVILQWSTNNWIHNFGNLIVFWTFLCFTRSILIGTLVNGWWMQV